jgi:hypothetical protein
MSNDFFQVKPVTQYHGAQYPSVYAGDPGDDRLEQKEIHPLTILMALVLVVGLTLGVAGCYQTTHRPHGDPPPDGGPGDGGPDGDPPGCDEGARLCTDMQNFQICDDGEWVTTVCEEWCDENYSPDAYATGCDADAEEPCRCEYDIIAGEPDPCYPNDLYCSDEWHLVLCSDEWREVDCNTYCQEQHEGSSEWYSNGCDQNNAADPCQCEYGMVDGGMPECEPGDVMCVNDRTAAVCTDSHEMREINCDQYCRDEHDGDPDWYSNGCSTSAEDFCQCEYGMLDGEMMECTPEDIRCIDDETFQTCQDGMFIVERCDDICLERYGDGAFSEGCDTSLDEPCRCIAASSGSGSGGEG